jgi:hypothetical protein
VVHALIDLSENTNRVLNVVKAKYDLKDKGEAIEFVVASYIEQQADPQLKDDFIQKLNVIKTEKSMHVADFARRYNVRKQK